MIRCFQVLLVLSTVALSWLLMLAVHESGHVLHGWLSGARLDAVHLPLIGFSRTDFSDNPHPLFVAWGGALWGSGFPLAIFLAVRCFAAKRRLYLLAWFAGFCLVANGGYLLGGAILTGGADDAGVILQHGGARWQLFVFGIVALVAGLYSWNGLGPYFGFGASRGQVDRRDAVWVTIALLTVLCLQSLLANA